jgi:hypothetical protein
VITTTQHIEFEARTSSPIRSRVGYSALQQVQAVREDVKVRDSDLHGREVVAKRRKRRKGHLKEMRPLQVIRSYVRLPRHNMFVSSI